VRTSCHRRHGPGSHGMLVYAVGSFPEKAHGSVDWLPDIEPSRHATPRSVVVLCKQIPRFAGATLGMTVWVMLWKWIMLGPGMLFFACVSFREEGSGFEPSRHAAPRSVVELCKQILGFASATSG